MNSTISDPSNLRSEGAVSNGAVVSKQMFIANAVLRLRESESLITDDASHVTWRIVMERLFR